MFTATEDAVNKVERVYSITLVNTIWIEADQKNRSSSRILIGIHHL